MTALQILGIAMIAAPFVALYAWITRADGAKVAVCIFASVAFVSVWLLVALWLVGKGAQL